MTIDIPNFDFAAPTNMVAHVEKIFRGEYDVDIDMITSPIILDIGANVGAFTVWAANRWPGSVVHSYEPLPENFNYLTRNIITNRLDYRVFIHQQAIAKCDSETADLYMGKNNTGEATFFKELEGADPNRKISVKVEDPIVLPQANILKIDTEGSELYILVPLIQYKREFDLILLEYHREVDRREIDKLLFDYTLIGSSVTTPGRGVVKYLHNRLIDLLKTESNVLTLGGNNE